MPRRQVTVTRGESRARSRSAALVAGISALALVVGCASGSSAVGEAQAPSESDAGSEPEAGAGGEARSEPEASAEDGDAPESAASPAGAAEGEQESEQPPSAPAQVDIASIGVHEQLVDLDIGSDGTLDAPSGWDDVGWFAGGGMPGGPGPTVLAGHVDSPTGPAVFYRLLELEPGDEVEVTDVDGRVHTYRVDRVEDHPKDSFPTQEVFGAVQGDEIRLLTCTGEFDAAQQRHLDNRVVFASSIDSVDSTD